MLSINKNIYERILFTANQPIEAFKELSDHG